MMATKPQVHELPSVPCLLNVIWACPAEHSDFVLGNPLVDEGRAQHRDQAADKAGRMQLRVIMNVKALDMLFELFQLQ